MASAEVLKREEADDEDRESRVTNTITIDGRIDSDDRKEVEVIVREALGDFGWWQARVCFCLSLLRIPIAWQELSIVFLAPPPGDYFCNEGKTTDGTYGIVQNRSLHEWDRCHYNKTRLLKEESGQENSTTSVPCQSWTYDHSIFKDTIISEWNLVCHRSQLANVAQSIFMFGILVGSVFFGIVADKFGRKMPLLASIGLQTTAGIGAACINSLEGFLVFRFLIAFATGGMMMTSFVICMEIVGGWWRTAAPILYHLPFGLGYSALGGISYSFPSWRQLQLAISIPCILLLSYRWLIPESPRWLLAMDHHKEAENVLGTAAKVNGRVWDNIHLTNLRRYRENRVNISSNKSKEENTYNRVDARNISHKEQHKENKQRKVDISDLLRTPNLRRKTLAISFSWLAAGLAFFGAAQYMSRLGGNIFINVAISGATQIMGTLISWYLMHKFGRRNTLLASHLFSGVSYILIACVLKSWEWLPVAVAANGLIGMAVALSTNYLYSCELFPTVVRNAGIGVASMCARIGSLTAPFLATLDTIHPLIPPITFGIFPLVAGMLVLLLPETSNQHLPDTIQEGEDFGKNKTRA